MKNDDDFWLGLERKKQTAGVVCPSKGDRLTPRPFHVKPRAEDEGDQTSPPMSPTVTMKCAIATKNAVGRSGKPSDLQIKCFSWVISTNKCDDGIIT